MFHRLFFKLLVLMLAAFVAPVCGDPVVTDGTVFGHVYDAESGDLISAAFVCCEGKTPVITNAEGYYEIEGDFAPLKSFTLTCYASGYPEAKKTLITDPQGNAEANFYLGSDPESTQIPKDEVDDLRSKLKDEDPQIRIFAISDLFLIGDVRDVDLFIEALDDEDYMVQCIAVHSLGQIGDTRAVDPLIETLRNEAKSRGVRVFAAEALGDIGDPKAVEALTYLARNDKDQSVRVSAAASLVRLGKDEHFSLVVNGLKDVDSSTRAVAAHSLGRIGDPRAVDPLIEVLDDENNLVRLSAANALGKIGDSRAIGPLLDVLRDKDPSVRYYATSALEKLEHTIEWQEM